LIAYSLSSAQEGNTPAHLAAIEGVAEVMQAFVAADSTAPLLFITDAVRFCPSSHSNALRNQSALANNTCSTNLSLSLPQISLAAPKQQPTASCCCEIHVS
jgi:hypothetical protein